ncbi:hypothetical protein V8B97DRAFT_2026180 [Scleroderma yunnanense]
MIHIQKQAIHIVQSLRFNRMSSDESDHEGHKGEVTYYILDKPWCSQWITAWLQMLNSLHLCLQYTGEWMTSLNESTRSPVKALPADFYSQDWYQAQNDFMKRQIKAAKSQVSLEIPSDYWK